MDSKDAGESRHRGDECKIIIDEGKKAYLITLNTEQIDLLRHSGESRRRLDKTLEEYGLKLIKHLQIVEDIK